MNNFYKHKRLFLQTGLIVGTVLVILLNVPLLISDGDILANSVYLRSCLASFGGIAVYILLYYLNRNNNKAFENIEIDVLKKNEQIILEGAANKYNDTSKLGGKLVLTDRRIIFVNRLGNGELKYCHYPLINTEKVTKKVVAGLYSSGIELENKGKIIRFSLDYANDWFTYIDLQITKSKSEKMILCSHSPWQR